MNTIGADRTYRVSGVNPYFMLVILIVFTLLAPVMFMKFIQTGEWIYLAWPAVIAWF